MVGVGVSHRTSGVMSVVPVLKCVVIRCNIAIKVNLSEENTAFIDVEICLQVWNEKRKHSVM